MFKDLRTHLNRLSAKRKATERASEADYLSKALKFYNSIATRLLNAERASIFIVDPESDSIWLKAGTGLEEHEIEVTRQGSIVGEVIESGQLQNLQHVEDMPGAHRETDAKTGFTTHSVLCVPIKDPDLGEVVGAMQVLNKQGADRFDAEDEKLLQDLAEHLQSRVTRIYLEQEVFGLSEDLVRSARRILMLFIAGVSALLFILFAVMFAWVVIPMFS